MNVKRIRSLHKTQTSAFMHQVNFDFSLKSSETNSVDTINP